MKCLFKPYDIEEQVRRKHWAEDSGATYKLRAGFIIFDDEDEEVLFLIKYPEFIQ